MFLVVRTLSNLSQIEVTCIRPTTTTASPSLLTSLKIFIKHLCTHRNNNKTSIFCNTQFSIAFQMLYKKQLPKINFFKKELGILSNTLYTVITKGKKIWKPVRQPCDHPNRGKPKLRTIIYRLMRQSETSGPLITL